jgi:hypothetical protein
MQFRMKVNLRRKFDFIIYFPRLRPLKFEVTVDHLLCMFLALTQKCYKCNFVNYTDSLFDLADPELNDDLSEYTTISSLSRVA